MTRRGRRVLAAYCAIVAVVAAGAWIALARSAGPLCPIGAYTTSMAGRTDDQIYNTRTAAQAIDGAVILPGETFSFNDAVGGWSADAGYRKAPVSFSGELIRDWGGGVCQTSTTLYNAALLAGMKIVERHRHYWPTTYVEPGRDAAVAFRNIDLRFTNPYPRPVRLSVEVRGSRLTIRLLSRYTPKVRYRIATSVLGVNAPSRVTRVDPNLPAGRVHTVVTGAPGFDVEVLRIATSPAGQVKRELISRDIYPMLHDLVAVGGGP